MKTTPNYGFSVPELTDKPDITVISKNFEQLDSTLDELGGGFVLMISEIPVSQRKKDTQYALIVDDFTN